MKKRLLSLFLALATVAGAQVKVSELTPRTGAGAATGDLLPIVDISAGAAGTKSITLAELFATPVPWTGVVITGQYGGTGVANTGKTITLGGNLTTSGAYNLTMTLTGGTSVTLPTTGTLATLQGTATNDGAPAGNIGEYVSSLVAPGSAVSLTTNVAGNVTSISLTAGDWDVEGSVIFLNAGSTVTQREACIHTTSATRLADGTEGYITSSDSNLAMSIPVSRKRLSLAATTTVYLVAYAIHSGGTVSAYGTLTARRVR